ncbi:MAG TPA: PLP-dependent aminotransferase family protein, partial [Caulobacteraceae bacterium]|nr:PLP-dependent aminotransferase family protein [Caulobacteraceae bacterium]
AATFAGVKTLAARAGYRLAPGEMDAEGLTPEALDRAAAAGAKVAYLMPVQNPTARVMSLERRTAVVEVARRRDLQIVEDDLYGAFAAPLGLPPLAALAPERTTYVGGLSKALAPGLRVGFLVPPAALAERMQEALRAIAFGAPTFGPAVAAAWIEDGTAFDILGEVLRETEARADIARSILGRAAAPSPLAAQPHLWLPMSELEAERLYGRALRAGVRLTPPGAVAVDGAPVQGLRLCLGGPASRVTLERGLRCVAQALTADPAEVGDVV